MRAVVHDRYGPPEVLRVDDVERPVPKEDEVLVRVRASTVTRTDVMRMRSVEYAFARVATGIRRPRRTSAGTEFAGVVDLWDAINEVVIMPDFTAEANAITRLAAVRGRVAMVRLAFETARETNPAARLVLNDFMLTAEYEQLIEECLAAGITIDAIGLQTHMHQGYKGEEHVISTVERFARLGLPIQLTETTLVSGDLMPAHIVDLNDWQVPDWPSTPEGEARQADELTRHYRSLVAHPCVESITYWGLFDDGAWLGAPAGLVRVDGTPKPSYEALHSLIRGQWWVAPSVARTDADGRLELRGFAGDYRITAGPLSTTVRLPTGATEVVESGPAVMR